MFKFCRNTTPDSRTDSEEIAQLIRTVPIDQLFNDDIRRRHKKQRRKFAKRANRFVKPKKNYKVNDSTMNKWMIKLCGKLRDDNEERDKSTVTMIGFEKYLRFLVRRERIRRIKKKLVFPYGKSKTLLNNLCRDSENALLLFDNQERKEKKRLVWKKTNASNTMWISMRRYINKKKKKKKIPTLTMKTCTGLIMKLNNCVPSQSKAKKKGEKRGSKEKRKTLAMYLCGAQEDEAERLPRFTYLLCGKFKREDSLQHFDLLKVRNETLWWSPNLLLHNTPTSKRLAFKRLVGGNLDERRRLFQTESEILKGLIHINIIHMTGYCYEGDEHVLVFDNVEGTRPLHHVLRDSLLTFDERVRIARQVAQGIHFLHYHMNPVTHANIHSRNILVGGRGENMAVRISNFEKAHHQRPQQDIYDFGILLLELVTGDDYKHASLISSSIKLQLSLIDPKIRNSITQEAARNLIMLAQDCIHPDLGKRPDAATISMRLRS
ncbi:probable serine/threonine-protein kinase [Tanacetum coccineum]